ncbi:succinate dehydrogenase assembly factor 2, mitochondrial [Cucurbita maxima]|uniref:Succinate dehydrogenase assembly factor 2, mitochondrial n=1 Tax=Cucurbita maxima TaxID=3661 RepID=A0A6J1JZA0_CUCMA|nr:succinate dehydrogenase assembly factor 2, mitochondrial [Cucurbita maxima]
MATFRRALVKAHEVLYLKPSSTVFRSKSMPLLPSAYILLENLQGRLPNHNQNQHGCFFSFRCSSTSVNPLFTDIDLSNEESKRRLFNRLLYRSKQRGFLELDLVLGKWVEDHINSLDADGISALIKVLDLENPDLWKWLTGQEQPPKAVKTNPVFTDVQEKVMNNLNKHASPETRTPPGQQWVRGWDDFKRGRDGPITGNQ